MHLTNTTVNKVLNCFELFDLMKEDLKKIAPLQREREMLWMEEGFSVCMGTVYKIQSYLKLNYFTTVQEEIGYFKIIKPKVIGQLFFFIYLASGYDFLPDESLVIERNRYYERQISVIERLLAVNKVFFDYYFSGSNERDVFYFTGAKNKSCDFHFHYFNDLRKPFEEKFDYLAGIYEASLMLKSILKGKP